MEMYKKDRRITENERLMLDLQAKPTAVNTNQMGKA